MQKAKYSIPEVASTVCIQHKGIRLFNQREVRGTTQNARVDVEFESPQIVYTTVWRPHPGAARQECSRGTMSETNNQASIGYRLCFQNCWKTSEIPHLEGRATAHPVSLDAADCRKSSYARSRQAIAWDSLHTADLHWRHCGEKDMTDSRH